MVDYFKRSQFRYIRSYVDITDDLDKILLSEEVEGNLETLNDKKNLHFKKLNDKIEIDFEGKQFYIDKDPICFFNEKNESLFKIYDSSDTNQVNYIFSIIDFYYICYLVNGEKIPYSKVLEKNVKKIILKKKINEYEETFKPLCNRLPTEGEYKTINTNYFLVEKSESLSINNNTEFKLFINQRIILIDKIMNFLENDKKSILKIYGSDGIGKSITFLYFTTIETKYKIIYFNIKDIFKYKSDSYRYFKYALMKYYSSNNYFLNKDRDDDFDKDKYSNLNYNIYLQAIQDLEKQYKNVFLSGDFWDILQNFCKYIESIKNSVIIIDQFKNEYDPKGNLNNIISSYAKEKRIKFIIASSLNDSSVKEDFVKDLMIFFKDELEPIKLPKGVKEDNEMKIVNELFKDFNFEQFQDTKDINKDFPYITIFNIDPINDSKKDNILNDDLDELTVENKILNNYSLLDIERNKLTEILYVNNLISIEKMIKDSEDKNLNKKFNFNPKTYTKYISFLQTNDANELKKNLNKHFLDLRFYEIFEKVDRFYKNLMRKNNNKYSSEYLKATFLLKLKDIIVNKRELDLKELIQSLEVFPLKYLKIYIAGDNGVLKENILDMNEKLKYKKFILDYSYDFIEIAFSKIIDMIPSSTLIDMKELSGSAIGSFLEKKIKKNIEKKGFIIRYCWNFTSITNSIQKENDNVYIYDYNTYTRNKLEYDDIKKYKINNYNVYYYIIPGSQINKTLDSIILQPTNSNSFNMISLQITKNKENIKAKEEYISATFIAKSKFESNYDIKIEKVYFYFILSEDFPSSTKTLLESSNISYFYYSIKDDKFTKDDKSIVDLEELNNEEARISQDIEDNEYKYFGAKKTLINLMEKFLQKKRKLKKDMKITENDYEKARRFLFKQTSNIILDSNIKDMMAKLVKNNEKYISGLFTFQFVFTINLNEYYLLKDTSDLIGIIIDSNKRKTKKSYHFIFDGEILPKEKNLSIDAYSKLVNFDKKRNRRLIPIVKDFTISEIPENFCNDRIFVFKIYQLIAKEEGK